MHLRGPTYLRRSMFAQNCGCRAGGPLEQSLLFLTFALQKNTWGPRNVSPTAFCSYRGTYLNVSLTDAHTFSCNLIIKRAKRLWCEAQCSVDGISFLQFNNINKTTPSGNLGNMANATEVQRCLTEHLDDLCQELRSKMDNLKTTGKCGIEYRSRDIVGKGRERAYGNVMVSGFV